MNAGSATLNGEASWSRLAGLPLVIEGREYDRLHETFAYEFERVTTQVRLVGAATDGLGDDVSVYREVGTALHETRPSLARHGERTLASFCDHLAALELWPDLPRRGGYAAPASPWVRQGQLSPRSDRLVPAREERDRFRCEAYRGFPGSTAGALFPGSGLVEPQHEFLDLG